MIKHCSFRLPVKQKKVGAKEKIFHKSNAYF